MKKYLSILALFSVTIAFSQTKLIAHKSHSGSNSSFKKLLINASFDMNDSNLGDIPIRQVRFAVLDTVKFISDSVAVMVTSEYCRMEDRRFNVSDTSKNESVLWRPGTDTVYNHPLLSQQHKLDSIKKVVDEKYYFRNKEIKGKKIVYLGYDNKKPKSKKLKKKDKTKEENNAVPVFIDSNPPSDFPFEQVGWFALIVILALFSAFFISKKRAQVS